MNADSQKAVEEIKEWLANMTPRELDKARCFHVEVKYNRSSGWASNMVRAATGMSFSQYRDVKLGEYICRRLDEGASYSEVRDETGLSIYRMEKLEDQHRRRE